MSSRGALMLSMLTKKDDTVIPRLKECPSNNASPKVKNEEKQNIFSTKEPKTLREEFITVPQEGVVPLCCPNEVPGPENTPEVLPVNIEELLLPQDQVTLSYWVPTAEEVEGNLDCAPKMATLEPIVAINVNDLPDPNSTLTPLVPLNYEDQPSNTLAPQEEIREDVVPLHIDKLLEPENTQEVVETENDKLLNEIGNLNVDEMTPNNNCLPQEENQRKELDGPTKRGTKRLRKKKSITLSEKAEKQIKKLKDNHHPRHPCGDKCRYKYSTRFKEEWRQQCNAEFWNKNFSERRNFIALCSTKLPVKRRRGHSETRNNSFRYFFNDAEGERVRVCKCFFLTTLGFTKENNSVVYDTLTSINKNTMTGMTSHSTDKRGKHPKPKKIDRDIIKHHIESYNPSISHYRREHAPNRRYLPNDVTIQRMYNDFMESEKLYDCSYDLYRKVINELNISFTKLGHEECGTCFKFKEHDNDHNQENLSSDCDVCMNWKCHINKANKSRNLYEEHAQQQSPSEDTLYFCADLQKVIMLPRMDNFKEVVFTRRMVAFNKSFVPLGTKKKTRPLAVLWHEAISGRKKEDIINAFYSFFYHFRDIKHICIWLDNCAGQNKNWALFTFFVYLVNYCPEIAVDKIDVLFFEPGHTFMAADSFHHQVELAMEHCGKVYDFQDFVKCVQKANVGKVDIKELGEGDLYEWKDCSSKQKLKCLENVPYLKDVVKVTAERGKTTLLYSTKYVEPPSKELNFIQAKYIKKISYASKSK